MANKTNPSLYYTRMDASKDDKRKMLAFIQDGDSVLDVGAGSGVVGNMILGAFPNACVTAIDSSDTAVERLLPVSAKYPGRMQVKQTEFLPIEKQKYDAVVFCSVLHEIFSYTEYEGRKFNLAIIEDTIKKAADMLNPGGRIIIRDGVAPSSNRKVMLRYLNEETRRLAERYEREFRGFDLGILHTQYGDIMPRRSAMELMYTITWGETSFDREVQEWYGYYSLEDWKALTLKLTTMGLRLTHIEKYLQQGYADNLAEKIELTSPPKATNDGGIRVGKASFPASNCLIVFEKD